jgi:hypothetical protein
MNDFPHWSLDQDPPRDESLGRLLRRAEPAAPGADVNWERLRAVIMRGVASASGAATEAGREWWEVVFQWRRLAAAASVAAMLAAGALLWKAGPGAEEIALTGDAAPESVALARVVASFPDEAVFSSLLQTARTDELMAWGAQ